MVLHSLLVLGRPHRAETASTGRPNVSIVGALVPGSKNGSPVVADKRGRNLDGNPSRQLPDRRHGLPGEGPAVLSAERPGIPPVPGKPSRPSAA
jgi:hypothetical protein